jgi:ABC-type Fe3+/spermidine/putrescine transport system ATPase subunit
MGISVKGLVKRYGGKIVVDHIDFEIADGELVSLLGPSGCGKTTTLRCIAGLETPESGRIEIDGQVVFDSASGRVIEPYHRDIGMVFQSYAIWPHMTVFENVAFPLRVRGTKAAEIDRRVTRALERVGLGAFHDRSSQQLSGGQQQRVAVARAIVHEPAVLLFDEPLSNLDARLRDETRAEIRQLQHDLKVSTIYVTHDQTEALSLSDRILVMHDGRIRQLGTPEAIYARPNDVFVAEVVGTANFFNVMVTADGRATTPGGVIFHSAFPASPGPARAMIRPDRLTISLMVPGSEHNTLQGVIRQRLFMGGYYEYLVETEAGSPRVLSSAEYAEQTAVALSFNAEDCIFLPPETGADRWASPPT